jgi:hypothetical protein
MKGKGKKMTVVTHIPNSPPVKVILIRFVSTLYPDHEIAQDILRFDHHVHVPRCRAVGCAVGCTCGKRWMSKRVGSKRGGHGGDVRPSTVSCGARPEASKRKKAGRRKERYILTNIPFNVHEIRNIAHHVKEVTGISQSRCFLRRKKKKKKKKPVLAINIRPGERDRDPPNHQ